VGPEEDQVADVELPIDIVPTGARPQETKPTSGRDEPDDGRTWMPTSLEDCDCNKICPESTDCTCLWLASTGVCECDCSGPIVIGPTLLAKDRIAISSQGKTLAELGELLNRLCEVELLIPLGGRARLLPFNPPRPPSARSSRSSASSSGRPAKHNPVTDKDRNRRARNGPASAACSAADPWPWPLSFLPARILIRSDSNSATVAKTLNSRRPDRIGWIMDRAAEAELDVSFCELVEDVMGVR
jgi:hypothetical protein